MERTFSIDTKRKKQLHKKYIKSKPVMWGLQFLFPAALIIFTAIFTVYAFGNADSFIVQLPYDSDYGKKDMIVIWGILICVDLILLFMTVVVRIAVHRFTGVALSERINESLKIEDGMLIYGYQNYAGSIGSERVVVRILLDGGMQITYISSLCRLVFTGKMNSTYYEDYEKLRTKADGKFENGEFVLFDYFEPSLKETLIQNRVKIIVTDTLI